MFLVLAAIVSLATAYSGHIDANAYAGKDISPYANFDNNTTFIGRHAFCDTNITHAHFETANVSIHSYAFDQDMQIAVSIACGNYSVTAITFPDCSVRDIYEILDCGFDDTGGPNICNLYDISIAA